MSKNVMTKKTKKFSRRFNPRLVKPHANYSTQEIADLFQIHINTVNAWYKSGLKTIDEQRFYLVFGEDLMNFLKKRNDQMKRKCSTDQFFCCKCKAPHKTQEGMAVLKVLNLKKVMIEGICAQCGTKMNKLGACARIDEYKKTFNIQVVQQGHLTGCDVTSVITDEKGFENDKI